MPRCFPLQDTGPGMSELFHDLTVEQEKERAAKKKCVCEDGHDRPYWNCPVHGDVSI